MAKEKLERVNLYFNLDDPIDAAVWEVIKDKKRKKGAYIKTLIYNTLNGLQQDIRIKEEVDEELTEEDVPDDDGIDF